MQAVVTLLTPRIKAWLGGVAELLPGDQTTKIALSLASDPCRSVDALVEKDEQDMLALPELKALKAGAKLVFKKKLAELKVSCYCVNAVNSLPHMPALSRGHTGQEAKAKDSAQYTLPPVTCDDPRSMCD